MCVMPVAVGGHSHRCKAGLLWLVGMPSGVFAEPSGTFVEPILSYMLIGFPFTWPPIGAKAHLPTSHLLTCQKQSEQFTDAPRPL